ncbi:hypothetical protein [Maribacter dokdonensis]
MKISHSSVNTLYKVFDIVTIRELSKLKTKIPAAFSMKAAKE